MKLDDWHIKLLESLALVLAIAMLRMLVRRVVVRRLLAANFGHERRVIASRAFNILYVVIALAILAAIWGLEGKQVLAFAASILAVVGIGFFAQWSLLSNITAGLILYFGHPMKIGDHITILDGENTLNGTVEDISLFFIFVKSKDGVTYTMPNSVAIQKTITIHK
ncbi:MAG: mechanosensitive ion channel [Bacteroidetes bacterium]|jgi:small-conductance mechanosensitive channel|nr:mechanosensitive ion channel [Bacteroidota bacterium]